MANWLEEEERRKARYDANRSLVLQTEEATHQLLGRFYELCRRASAVRSNSLAVGRLCVTGPSFTIEDRQHNSDRNLTSAKSGRRAVAFRFVAADEILAEALVREYQTVIDEGSDHSYDLDRLITRWKSDARMLSDWPESLMLQTIQWLLLESEAIERLIPGTVVDAETAALKRALYHPPRGDGLSGWAYCAVPSCRCAQPKKCDRTECSCARDKVCPVESCDCGRPRACPIPACGCKLPHVATAKYCSALGGREADAAENGPGGSGRQADASKITAMGRLLIFGQYAAHGVLFGGFAYVVGSVGGCWSRWAEHNNGASDMIYAFKAFTSTGVVWMIVVVTLFVLFGIVKAFVS